MRHWPWWIVVFVCLAVLCCIASCVVTRLTSDVDAMRQDAMRSNEMAETYLVGLLIGASLEHWLIGMLVVIALMSVFIWFTIKLERRASASF
jgi:ABC-type Mn2+/Zn2+ transport system permease subunit